MLIYAAGNFETMKSPETEQELFKILNRNKYTYRRLISFYYMEPWGLNVLQAQKNIHTKLSRSQK